MAHVLNTTGCWECCQLSASAWKSERHDIRRELKAPFNRNSHVTSLNNAGPHENVRLAHLRGVRRTAGQLLEQLQQREEALEDDAVRNVQSTQLQQEDRLRRHHSQRSYREITKRHRRGTRALGPKYRPLLSKHSFFRTVLSTSLVETNYTLEWCSYGWGTVRASCCPCWNFYKLTIANRLKERQIVAARGTASAHGWFLKRRIWLFKCPPCSRLFPSRICRVNIRLVPLFVFCCCFSGLQYYMIRSRHIPTKHFTWHAEQT